MTFLRAHPEPWFGGAKAEFRCGASALERIENSSYSLQRSSRQLRALAGANEPSRPCAGELAVARDNFPGHHRCNVAISGLQ